MSRTQGSVAIVGLGYVGLPTALALLSRRVEVIGYDTSERRIAAIKKGDVDLIPADHKRLAEFGTSRSFGMATDSRRLRDAGTVLICVPTPVDEHHVPELTAIRGACQTVVEQARRGQTLVLTSTTYVGCTEELLVEPLTNRGFRVGQDIHVAFSPERIDPGNEQNVQETVPRVIGGYTRSCAESAADVIGQVASSVYIVDSLGVAEMSKILENTFRAVNIALVNEFANIAHALGIDITKVIQAAATKPYGFMPFRPGPGVGGHCIPCDPHYLLWQLPALNTSAPVVQAAMMANASRPHIMVDTVSDALGSVGKSIGGARICVVGVAFKPNVSDTRETPARNIIKTLIHMGADVHYYDPLVDEFVVDHRPIRRATPDADRYDIVVVLNAHTAHDYSWVSGHSLVVDASYKMDAVKHRILP